MKPYRFFILLILSILLFSLLLSACSPAVTPSTAVAPVTSPTAALMPSDTPTATDTAQPQPGDTAAPSATAPKPTLGPDDWKSLPVIPAVSDTARAIYQKGLALGNDPARFSRIGDCQNISTYFLAGFDQPGAYQLGEYTDLQGVIDHFAGSFGRTSLAVKGGFNVAAILSPLHADRSQCESTESPLACELRANKPAIAILSFETWWSQKPAEVYESYLRQVIDYTIAQGVVPILATKADNLEGDNSINQAIARVAADYDIPLWNYWAAAQPLPNHGLTADGFHLTHADFYDFSSAENLTTGWAWRNLTALQALDAVWKGLEK
ncbi:hypothetical protein LARV_03888 [Longilinea arvoryzae]|uniref:SGNH/GDSL hydrolase family protein n=1 Tax=Longilinea arvoryzae TaxID=360412 RepID=A0A0K8MZL8_9CHLR|nr:SGNH/GDSL hydrolase family protein [Longilinea arvoryzae]GAP16092.1 hypothetical protein LARV_03888 [Longilinea arvoryzae]